MELSNKYVIAINRELGSGGRTVGQKLAEKLGVSFYDKAHIRAVQEKYGLNVEDIERLKAKKTAWWPDFKRIVELNGGFAVSIYANLPDLEIPEKPDSKKIFDFEQEVLEGIADAESCVIAGRSSFYTFRNHPNHLSVLIQSPMEQRVERIMKKKGLTEKEAVKLLNDVDNMRETYIKRHTGTTRYDTRNYDLVISMKGKTEDEAVDLILNYIGYKK